MWWRIAAVVFCGIFILPLSFATWAVDEVPAEYERFFVYKRDSRSALEKLLNAVNLTSKDVGRGFAIVAGVSRYPNLSGSDRSLDPAEQDMRKLVVYLRDVELFDEIIVIKNEDMNFSNLRYFLQAYIPDRLNENMKSRFLFAYSGHGFNDDFNAYLLESTATSMEDKAHAINLTQIRGFFSEIVRKGHQVLVMLNACYSGAFLKRSFGDPLPTTPKLPGAHAITAGGSNERTWHDPKVGSGSVFFEKFFAGTWGIADTYPVKSDGTRGDGIVTVRELATYLEEEIRISSDQRQNPQSGDISINGGEGGGFFFLNRRVQVEQNNIAKIDFFKSFGVGPAAAKRGGSTDGSTETLPSVGPQDSGGRMPESVESDRVPPHVEPGKVTRTANLITDAVVAGAGRYVVLRQESSSRLLIYGTVEQKILGTLRLRSDNFLYTAGGDTVLVYYPFTNIMQTWSLTTLETVLTKQSPVGPITVRLTMGHRDGSRALVRYAAGTGDTDRAGKYLLDPPVSA